MLKNRDLLLELLQDANDFAKMKQLECPPIYLLGGSGCVLGNFLERATLDIDFIDIGYSASTGKIFRIFDTFDMLDLYVTPIAEGFETRAIKLEGFDTLDYYVLSAEDLIVSKLGRFSEKDQEDIKKLMSEADKRMVLKLIELVKDRADFSERVKYNFSLHALLFKEQYYV